jgi:diguanylate cyclase (GGDEF)-like protein
MHQPSKTIRQVVDGPGSEPTQPPLPSTGEGAEGGGADVPRAYDATPLYAGAGDLRLAGYSAAALFLTAAVLLGTAALPLAHPPSTLALAIIGGVAVFAGVLAVGLTRTGHATLRLLFAAELAGVGLVAALVAVSGREHSIYATLYLFAVVHAAAFQPRRRLAIVMLAASAGFLAPLVYGHSDKWFLAIALVSMPPVIMVGAVIAIAARVQRGQRSQLVAQAAEARRLAENDALTGLGNYRMFWRHLDAEVARSRRHGDPFSLVILDLNGFKAINDEYGHQAGDRALRQVASALREALRGEDVCCRQGGDEFAVIAVRAEATEAEELAERLTRAVGQIPVPGAESRRLGASAGWATFGHPATTADELILSADEALRAVKRGGREPVGESSNGSERPEGAGERPEREPAADSSPARLVVLAAYGRALAGARDERAIAETTVAHLAGAVDAATAMVLRRDTRGGPARLVAAAGERGVPDGHGMPPAVDRALARAAMDENRSLVTADLDPSVAPDAAGAELAVPIEAHGEVWGCLLIESRRSRIPGGEERAMAEAMGTQMGRALSYSRVLERLPGAEFGELYRLAASVESTQGESWRVADLAWQVGRRLDFSSAGQRALYLAALFHDLGTVGVPDEVMAKPGRLSRAERAVLHEHPLLGERLMRPLPLLREASRIVLHQHEHYDGTGYPDGLAGEEIPLASRVLLACEAWVAMTSPRPWRDAQPADRAHEELRRVAGAQLDPNVVAVLTEALMGDESATRAPR